LLSRQTDPKFKQPCGSTVASTGHTGTATSEPCSATCLANWYPLVLSPYIYCSKRGDSFPPQNKIPPPYKLSKSFGLTILPKPRFNLQMSVIFNLFVCPGLNVLCCLRPTRRAEEPKIISSPANTTLEPLERPIMQLASDLPRSVTAAQIPSELPAIADPVPAQHSQKKQSSARYVRPMLPLREKVMI